MVGMVSPIAGRSIKNFWTIQVFASHITEMHSERELIFRGWSCLFAGYCFPSAYSFVVHICVVFGRVVFGNGFGEKQPTLSSRRFMNILFVCMRAGWLGFGRLQSA